jgi:hypothetical protein
MQAIKSLQAHNTILRPSATHQRAASSASASTLQQRIIAMPNLLPNRVNDTNNTYPDGRQYGRSAAPLPLLPAFKGSIFPSSRMDLWNERIHPSFIQLPDQWCMQEP